MKDDHPTEMIPALSLGCLDTEERKRVELHLAGCEKCRSELSAYHSVAGKLIYGAMPATPSPGLKKRLLNRISEKPATYKWFEKLLEKWPRFVPAAALTSFILFLTLGTTTFYLVRSDRRLELLSPDGIHLVVLRGTAEVPEAVGTLVITDGQDGLFLVTALPHLDSTSQYQLWLIKDGRRTSGGVFSVSSEGQARIQISASRPLNSFDAFGVTIEPFGGSPGPTGKKVLGGQLKL